MIGKDSPASGGEFSISMRTLSTSVAARHPSSVIWRFKRLEGQDQSDGIFYRSRYYRVGLYAIAVFMAVHGFWGWPPQPLASVK